MKHQKKLGREKRKMNDLKSFAKKEIFSLTEKHIGIAVYTMKL